ncbi:MAG TPA: hypothetical protein VGS11_02525 [Candidatus Bathyarchaeia archaeon]|nr:hypothetical protein [Candidatus Bathyarchaeia archaeon]
MPSTRNAKEAVELPQLLIMVSEQSECPEIPVLVLKLPPRFSMNSKPRLPCIVHEPLKDLNNESFSPEPEANVTESVRDL